LVRRGFPPAVINLSQQRRSVSALVGCGEPLSVLGLGTRAARWSCTCHWVTGYPRTFVKLPPSGRRPMLRLSASITPTENEPNAGPRFGRLGGLAVVISCTCHPGTGSAGTPERSTASALSGYKQAGVQAKSVRVLLPPNQRKSIRWISDSAEVLDAVVATSSADRLSQYPAPQVTCARSLGRPGASIVSRDRYTFAVRYRTGCLDSSVNLCSTKPAFQQELVTSTS
jgi:hypothetical protein